MKRIICLINPFDGRQELYVYENGNKIAVAQPTIDELPKVLFAFSDTHKTGDVTLVGPSHYLKGLISHIKKEEVKSYGHNALNIVIN